MADVKFLEVNLNKSIVCWINYRKNDRVNQNNQNQLGQKFKQIWGGRKCQGRINTGETECAIRREKVCMRERV